MQISDIYYQDNYQQIFRNKLLFAETALFVYRYHRIEQRSMALKKFLTSEYERLTPIVKAEIEKMTEIPNVKDSKMDPVQSQRKHKELRH